MVRIACDVHFRDLNCRPLHPGTAFGMVEYLRRWL